MESGKGLVGRCSAHLHRTAAWLRESHIWDGGCPFALTAPIAVTASTHPCARVHVQGLGSLGYMQSTAWKALPSWHGGQGPRAVSTQRTPSSPHGGQFRQHGDSGCVKSGLQSWSELCLLQQLWVEQGLPGRGLMPEAAQEEGELFPSSPQHHGLSRRSLCPHPRPPSQHHEPQELQLRSTKQPGSGQLGRPAGRAGLTIAARDSRRAFGAVGLYVWRDLGSR